MLTRRGRVAHWSLYTPPVLASPVPDAEMAECDDVNADMDEGENPHHADNVRNVDIVHPVHLVSVDHVNPDAGSQTSSALPHTKLSPCNVL